VKKHSWVWRRTWRIWRKPARICVRCQALLRSSPAGPRGGGRYSYQGPNDKAFRQVPRLPECERPDKASDLSPMVRELPEPPRG